MRTRALPACYGRSNLPTMIDGFWISALILLVMTVGVIYFRIVSKTTESNWPLVYYFFAVLHLQLYTEGMYSGVVFASTLTAMFLRFEFLSGWIQKLLQAIEYFCLVLIGYRLLMIILG